MWYTTGWRMICGGLTWHGTGITRWRGYAAGTDCARVGEVTTLRDSAGEEYVALYADCAGDAATMDWMLANRIVVELDAELFERLTAAYGRPLEVSLK